MTSNRRATAQRGPWKSPLRLAADPAPVISPQSPWPPDGIPRADRSPREMRQMMISEFGDWLRSRTNRHKRPFQEETISAYRDAAVALDAWMTRTGLESDFTGCDTATLNQFFRWYHGSHGQGGTNTKQRNLRHLFTWLEAEYGNLHPYTDDLVRYAPAKVRPATLAADFIKDLLEVTGGGRARDFENARDYAIIRMLAEGVRRMELVQQQIEDLPVDLIARPYVRVVPLKDARAEQEGRIVPLTLATARAFAVYLRARRSHRRAESCRALWLGTRNRGPLTGSGVYRTPAEIMQPVYAATTFYNALIQVPGWQALPLTVAAQDVQHSARPGAYAQWQPLATALADTFSGAATACLADNGLGVPASGYDCSGLAMMAYRAAGISLPRTTFQQVYSGIPVYSLSQLQPGDLLFTAGSDGTPEDPGHVGMYLGSGLVIEAPQIGEPIMITPLAGYWQQQTVAIRRIT